MGRKLLVVLGILIIIAPLAAAESGSEMWRGAAWISGIFAAVLIFMLLWAGGAQAAPEQKH
jgi:hypothetical protein